jgi:tyrosine-protein kinase Etk/Wzc
MYQEQDDFINAPTKKEEIIDIQKFLKRLFSFWPYFLLSVTTALFFAYLYAMLATPAYRSSLTILIKEERGRRTPNLVSTLDVFGSQTNLYNEIGILQSHSLHYKTVEDLGLFVIYNQQGKYREKNIYREKPFLIIPDTSQFQALNVEVEVKPLNDTHVRIICNLEDRVSAVKYSTGETMVLYTDGSYNQSFEVKYGELFQNPYFAFTVIPLQEPGKRVKSGDYSIIFREISGVASSYRSRFTVDPINKESTILKVSLVDAIPTRSIDYLNKFAENYIEMGMSEKNLIASKTIEFIDFQLSGITDTLSVIEKDLEAFRTQNKIVDLSIQGQTIFTKLQTLEYEKSMDRLRVGYYEYLLDYVQTDTIGKDIIAPSAIGVNDPLLTQLIAELSLLYTSRDQLKATSSSKNPSLISLNNQINELRKRIVENVSQLLNNARYTLKEKETEIERVQAQLQTLPQTERQLISIERMFTVNDQIYTFLLQKRAEAAISKASSIADHKVLDSARLEKKIRPKKTQIYLIAFLLGIIIPALLIIIIDLIRNTIKDISDIEALLSIPILGNVIRHEEGDVTVNTISGAVAESFRVIRTNLDFFVPEKERKIIAISSMHPAEGKSFCSFHLAYVFSLAGKRTLLVGADIRKPDLGKVFNVKKEQGLSSFLSHRNTWDEVVYPSGIENFDFIPGGLVPPNPAELLSADNVERIFENLDPYDIVIFDTSPVGIIADAAYIMRKADINLFVVRYHVSRKPNVKLISHIIDKLKVKNSAVVCNDFKRRSRKYYYYYYYSKMKVRGDQYYRYSGSGQE